MSVAISGMASEMYRFDSIAATLERCPIKYNLDKVLGIWTIADETGMWRTVQSSVATPEGIGQPQRTKRTFCGRHMDDEKEAMIG